ncbi:MAG: hypothetical protein JEZ02_11335 [Desulfatibacillum sp.]|nr:hypothetical protein [Desulfatibacillum sp.]
MQKKRSWKKTIGLLVLVLFLVQTAACGFIVYPERRGQAGGRVDAGVVVMDGLCLLLFIIPGVIAFAVDFSSGAIYLPGGRAALDDENVRVVMADPKDLDNATLERIVHEQTGLSIEVKNATMKPLDAETPDRIGQVLDDLEQHGNIG